MEAAMAKPNSYPGLKRLPKPDGEFAWYWAASQMSRRAANFMPRTELLWRGKGQPKPWELAEIQSRCLALSGGLSQWLLDPANLSDDHPGRTRAALNRVRGVC